MKQFLTLTITLIFAAVSLHAQIKVSGIVTATDGEPLIGASVVEQGAKHGTATNLNGEYEISVKEGATLIFSYVGYETARYKVTGEKLNVTLKEDQQMLEEVVVVGYGIQKKSDVTGAISSLNSADLENRSTTDVNSSLAGKTSGVQVISSSGKPGASSEIRVRGYSSNSGSLTPLYIVDGLQVGDISYLDPNNIENIEVLKDAASAAIYGAQAGNGVVLVTTKTGANKGQGKITYDLQLTSSSLASAPKMLKAQEYINYMTEGNFITREDLLSYYDGHTNTNWLRETFEHGFTQRHTLGFSGGNDRGNLFVSLAYLDNDGIVKGNKDYYKRLSSQINADYKIKNWFKIGITSAIERTKSKSVSEGSEVSLLTSAIVLDPLTPAYFTQTNMPWYMSNRPEGAAPYLTDSDGRIFSVSPFTGSSDTHPLISRDNNESSNTITNYLGTIYGELTPFKGFIFTSKFGYRIGNVETTSYTFPYYINAQNHNDTYNLSGTILTSLFYQWENYANYMFKLGRNEFTATAGMSYVHSENNFISGSGDELKNYASNFRFLSYLTTECNDNVTGEQTESSNMSYFGRLTWNFDNRYTLQGILRADAFDSSKLSKNNRWGIFPSVSAGWTISNESFMKSINTSTLSFLKLRASWGRNGNINVLSGYPYLRNIAVGSFTYNMSTDPTLSYGAAPVGLTNPDLKWETSEQYDFGIDARFFNSRLVLTADYYVKNTKDLLVNVTPPYETGATSVMMNAGKVRNSGFEMDLTWRDRIGDFSYSVSANLATLSNKVTYLDPTVPRITGGNYMLNPVTMFEVGNPVWYMYGYKFKGVDQTNGNPIFVDVNEDGIVDENDKTRIGCAIPEFTYGITLNASYKGFDLTVFGTGVQGNDIWCCLQRNDAPKRNILKTYYDNRWTEENPMGIKPRAGAADSDKYLFSDANIFNGSYFKIKQIQLGYTLPKNILKKLYIENLRIYTSMDDWFTFTNYPGFDPEVASSNSSTEMGLDKGCYPVSKKLVFGLNLTF